MSNAPRDFRSFLTTWERLDVDAQGQLVNQAARTLKKLRGHRKDIDQRIAYWEENLKNARASKRQTESHGRGRERESRIRRPTTRTERRRAQAPLTT